MDRRLKSSLTPSFFISRLLCFTPYDNAGKVSRKRLLLSVFINLAILGFMARGFWAQFNSYELYLKQNKRLHLARHLSHCTAVAAAVCSQMYWFTFEPKLLKSIFNRIETLSKAFHNTIHFTRVNWITGTASAIFALAALSVSLINHFARWYLGVPMYFIPNILLVLVIAQITALLEVTRCLFQRLNKEVRQSKDLYRCTQIHAVLCSVVRDVNRLHSSLLLFTVTDLLIHVTTQVYDVFRAIADSKPPDSKAALAFLPARLTFIWSVCYFTTEVCWECDAFFRHMLEAMRARRYPCYDPTLTLYAGVKPSVSISAAGLFTVSNHIITSILATGTTYFIVLIQLE